MQSTVGRKLKGTREPKRGGICDCATSVGWARSEDHVSEGEIMAFAIAC